MFFLRLQLNRAVSSGGRYKEGKLTLVHWGERVGDTDRSVRARTPIQLTRKPAKQVSDVRAFSRVFRLFQSILVFLGSIARFKGCLWCFRTV